MRYYSIELYPSNGKPGSAPLQVWTSYPKGQNDPGALNVELDLLASYYGIPQGDVGNSTVTIEGIPLSDLWQASQFFGLNITVRGGMQKGLPLANPAQAGILMYGMVYESFGNWVGTDMNLNFVIVPSGFDTAGNPGNFSFTWKAGSSLGQAITTTLQIAYQQQGYGIDLQIADTYTAPGDIHHIAPTLPKFAQFIEGLTRGKVHIALQNNSTVLVTDGTRLGKSVQLAFTDLIGQPRWVQPNVMQFTTVMRADIQVGTMVRMPQGLQDLPGIVTTAAASLPSQLKYQTSFQGSFMVQSVRHIGNFRDANGQAWCSTYMASVTRPT